ncbi:MAG: hypothetical protein ACK5MG_09740 [Bacteroidales bacterium]
MESKFKTITNAVFALVASGAIAYLIVLSIYSVTKDKELKTLQAERVKLEIKIYESYLQDAYEDSVIDAEVRDIINY